MTFKESEVLSPGSEFASFETDFGAKIGLGICYDIRFPDLAQIYARDFGCNLLVYPGAFNMTTGKNPWILNGFLKVNSVNKIVEQISNTLFNFIIPRF